MTVRDATNPTEGVASALSSDQETWLRSAIDCAGMGAWRAWPETGDFEATVGAKRLHGLPDDAPLDETSAMDVIHPDDRDRVRIALQSAMERGADYRAEFRTVLPDGTIRWLLSRGRWMPAVDGQPAHMIGIVQDISERKQAEDALAQNEERLREAQDIAGLAFWEFIFADNTVIWSDAMFRLLGREALQGPPTLEEVRSLLHPDDQPFLDTFLENAAAACQDYEADWRLRHADGTYRWVRTRARAFADANGHCVRLFGTDLDITERKRVDEDLRRLVEQREILVREAHHRIKNNVASIAALLAMQARSQTSDTVREALLDAQQRVHTVGRIHEALYRSESFTSVDVGAHLQALMKDIAQSSVTRQGRAPTLRLQCPVGVELSADTVTPLSMIAVELVTNALKHASGDKDEVEIDVALSGRTTMRLVVADNGPGLPAGARSTGGLGMRLVDLLVQQLRGTVSYKSGPMGLRVTVAFSPSPAL